MSYEGEAWSGWLGVDARAGRWVAGLALSHGVTEADYPYDGGEGEELETTLTALYPYGRWTLAGGLELRGVLGAGTGEARHVPEEGERETRALEMGMTSVGVRQELPAVAGNRSNRSCGALWRDEMPRLSGGGNEAAMDARLGYGIALAPEDCSLRSSRRVWPITRAGASSSGPGSTRRGRTSPSSFRASAARTAQPRSICSRPAFRSDDWWSRLWACSSRTD